MEAWDDGPRVRPIPLDEEAGIPVPEEFGETGRRRVRPWVPISLALVGFAVAVASVSVFGALRFDDPPPPTDDEFAADVTDEEGSTTTATTLPPRLDELLPNSTDRLTLIAERDGVLYALLWDPSFREPKPVVLGIEETPAASFTGAWFDRSGRLAAVERCGSLRCDLFVGDPSDLGTTAALTGIIGFTWHASEIGRLAWVERAEDGYAVVTGHVNPLSGTVQDVRVAFTTPEPVRLVQWDGLGFVTQSSGGTARGTTASAVTPEGATIWERPGLATTATSRIVAVAEPMVVGGEDAEPDTTVLQWGIVDRSSGEPIEGPTPNEGSIVFVGTSESADLVAQLSARETGPYSLRISGGSIAAQRVVTVQQRYVPAGFTDDGSYFMFVGGDRNLVFVEWNRGTSHEIVAPEGYRILGLDLG